MRDYTEDEKKHRRTQYVLAASAGVLVGVLLARGVDVSGIFEGGNNGTEAAPFVPPGLDGESTAEPTIAPEAPVETPAAPEVTPDARYDIQSGDGGVDLMAELGVPESERLNAWASMQGELIARFPNEFYQEAGQMVRINNTGPLPIEVQQFISERVAAYGGR